MAGVLQPLDELTEENTGPAVIIVIYSIASVTIGVTVIRFWLQKSRGIPFCLDDGAYVVANLWAVISTILWTLAVHFGLGQRSASLSASDIDRFFKFEYAAQLIEIVAMLCAKAAFILLLDRVAPGKRWIKIVALSSVGAWATFCFFALLFQCPFPRPWVFEPAQCPTHGRLLYPIIVFNGITDVGLALWIVPNVWGLQMQLKDRIWVVFLFCMRACILVPIITEISLMHLFLDNNDQTRVTVNRTILNQIIVYLSIMTAAIPRTNQFLFHLSTHRNDFALPDFEIFDAGQMTEPKSDPPLQLVPAHDSVLSASISSDNSNGPRESDAYAPRSVRVRKEIVVVESSRSTDEHTT